MRALGVSLVGLAASACVAGDVATRPDDDVPSQATSPREDWRAYPIRLGGADALVTVDLGVANDLDRLPDRFVALRIEHRAGATAGAELAPPPSSVDAVVRCFDSCVRRHAGRVVGTVVHSGATLCYAYVDATERQCREIATFAGAAGAHAVFVSSAPDPAHAEYAARLAPAPHDARVIDDAERLIAMREDGADLGRPRAITHRVRISSEASAAVLAEWGRGEGYSASSVITPSSERHVLLTHSGAPTLAAISARSERLRAVATALGAEYLGWECPLAVEPSRATGRARRGS